MRLTATCLFLFLLSLIARLCPAADSSACAAITDAQRAKLAGYIQKRYNLPESTRIGVHELTFVDESCYRKLEFTSTGAAQPFRVELFASPDLLS